MDKSDSSLGKKHPQDNPLCTPPPALALPWLPLRSHSFCAHLHSMRLRTRPCRMLSCVLSSHSVCVCAVDLLLPCRASMHSWAWLQTAKRSLVHSASCTTTGAQHALSYEASNCFIKCPASAHHLCMWHAANYMCRSPLVPASCCSCTGRVCAASGAWCVGMLRGAVAVIPCSTFCALPPCARCCLQGGCAYRLEQPSWRLGGCTQLHQVRSANTAFRRRTPTSLAAAQQVEVSALGWRAFAF